MGTYTLIAIGAVNEAQEGQTVNVTAGVKNLHSSSINLTVTGLANGLKLYFDNVSKWVNPGATEYWYDAFIMPAGDVTVKVYSWFLSSDGNWYVDDEASKVVKYLSGAEAKFSGLVASYARV
jgi:hypothetical protein